MASLSQVHGNLSHAMRDNYNEHGVDEYYRKVSATYRNPFYPGIKKVVWTLMNRWWDEEGRHVYRNEQHGADADVDADDGRGETSDGSGNRGLKVLDMAAGSGEATLCLLEWAEQGQRRSAHSSHTASTSSSSIGQAAADPLAALRSHPLPAASPPGRTSASGSSTVTTPSRPAFIPPNARRSAVMPGGATGRTSSARVVFDKMDPPSLPKSFSLDIVATDPYTAPAYTARTSRSCHALSFTDLANGLLPPATTNDSDSRNDNEPIWDMIICSFALHLVTTPSELFALLFELSGKARWLMIVAPHKKPEIKETWGWARWDIASWSAAGEGKLYSSGGKSKAGDDEEEETELEIVRDKVKLRLYRSNAF